MEKLLKNIFDFIKNNKLRVLIATVFLTFMYLFVNRQLIEFMYSNFGRNLVVILNTVFNMFIISSIYFILFKINREENSKISERKREKVKKFLILFLILIGFEYLNIFIESIRKFYDMFFYVKVGYYQIRLIEKFKLMMFTYLYIFGLITYVVGKTLSLVSIFTILGDKGESKISLVNIFNHFSKTVSKRVLIFISLIYLYVTNILKQRGFLFFENQMDDGMFVNSNLFPLESPIRFPYLIGVFGAIIILILIKTILDSDEILSTTKVLRGKNLKYYFINMFSTIIVPGLFFLLLYKVFNYFVYEIDNQGDFLISILGRIFMGTVVLFLFLVQEFITYKVSFKDLGKDIKISLKKFFKAMNFTLKLALVLLTFLNRRYVVRIIVLSIILKMIVLFTNEGNLSILLTIGYLTIGFIIYVFYILFSIESISILIRNENISFEFIERFFDLKVRTILLIILSYFLLSIGYTQTILRDNIYIFSFLFLTMRYYINLSLCDYYLREGKNDEMIEKKGKKIKNKK